MADTDEDDFGEYASPPCFMHEVDPAYLGFPADRPLDKDVLRWRKATRARLIVERLAIAADLREAHARRMADALDKAIGDVAGLTISAYWPFRGEPDLRPWLGRVIARGGRAALPVVIAKKTPLIFRLWKPGDRLEKGLWNIPTPADGEEVAPDIVIAPVVGFDPACYRLGYGGGFFDRTLAILPRRRQAIAIGYGQALIPTIYPQPHDVPFDLIVTEDGIVTPNR
jgi:5,10-methenyltetrahydrofolate synthetase